MNAELAHINPDIIEWALARLSASPEEISTRQLPAEKIRDWASGEGTPTQSQAETLAQKLKIPYLLLFLNSAPDIDGTPIPDLRTRRGEPPRVLSREFIGVINDALIKQDWFREEAVRLGRPRLSYVGKFDQSAAVSDVAKHMRTTLGINEEFRQSCRSWDHFLRKLVARVEDRGVLVLRNGVLGHATRYTLNASEFQGFALSDTTAPLIFVNDRDYRAAQIFTVAHELAHIWIGSTGISDPSLRSDALGTKRKVEAFCNRVAAEFLVPEKSVRVAWQGGRSDAENIKKLQRYFWVSSLVAIRRAYDVGKIDLETFKSNLDREYERFRTMEERKKKKEAEKEQKGDFWSTFKLRNSASFSDAVAKSLRDSSLTYTRASSLLGVSISTVERFMRRERAA